MTTNTSATLTDSFEDTFTNPGQAADRNVVIVSWPSVPVEIIRAAGLRPFIVACLRRTARNHRFLARL